MLLGALRPALAQSDLPQRRLEIARLDLAQFPTVGVNLIVTDRQSRPVRELRMLRLRESGAPIADYELALQTVGTELIMVVDANSRIQEADDESGLTRLQKVKDSIMAYAGRFMDLAGRDRVTVLVPDGEEGRALAENVALPAELIEAVQGYDAGRLPQSPVIAMLEQALERVAAQKAEGRFQAIVLYSDGSSLNEARFGPLLQRARELQTPIFVLLLGLATPNENAAQAASALTAPTRGFFAPMPLASDSSEVFQVIADNGVQGQLRYRSNVRRSGAYSVTVTLDNLRADATLSVELAPPLVQLQAPDTIRRAGALPDTPLEALQPEVQPLSVELSWPDGLPRALAGAALRANGEQQDAPFFGAAPLLQFEWRVAALEAGSYELVVVVTDTLGMTARSEAQTTAIVLSRPEAEVTPLPTPTLGPREALRRLLPAMPQSQTLRPYLAPAAGALGVLLLALAAARRVQGRRREQEEALAELDEAPDDALEASAPPGERAYLQRLVQVGESAVAATAGAEAAEAAAGAERLWLAGGNVTIGAAAEEVQLVIDEPTISGLHARIRWRAGDYWLYDEGSEQGTYLNYARLGLAPRRLKEGDDVQLGRVRFRFGIAREPGQKPVHVA